MKKSIINYILFACVISCKHKQIEKDVLINLELSNYANSVLNNPNAYTIPANFKIIDDKNMAVIMDDSYLHLVNYNTGEEIKQVKIPKDVNIKILNDFIKNENWDLYDYRLTNYENRVADFYCLSIIKNSVYVIYAPYIVGIEKGKNEEKSIMRGMELIRFDNQLNLVEHTPIKSHINKNELEIHVGNGLHINGNVLVFNKIYDRNDSLDSNLQMNFIKKNGSYEFHSIKHGLKKPKHKLYTFFESVPKVFGNDTFIHNSKNIYNSKNYQNPVFVDNMNLKENEFILDFAANKNQDALYFVRSNARPFQHNEKNTFESISFDIIKCSLINSKHDTLLHVDNGIYYKDVDFYDNKVFVLYINADTKKLMLKQFEMD